MNSDSMLALFALSPDALTETDRPGHHERFLRQWMNHGILIHNAPTIEASEIHSVVSTLPQQARKLWAGALKKTWSKACPDWKGCKEADTAEDFRAVADEIETLVLDETRHAVLLENLNTEFPELECSLLDDFDNSNGIKTARDLSAKFIKDVTVEQLWKQRFSRMAQLARWVIIVDSYALADDNVAGLKQFLLRLDAEPETKTKVTIYSAYGRNGQNMDDAAGRVAEIRKQLCRGGIGDIDLWLLESRKFNKHVLRDRFIVFDHLVVELGHGIMLFAEKKAYPMTFTSKLKQTEHTQTIKELRQEASVDSHISV